MIDLQWFEAALKFLVWMVPVLLIAGIGYSLSLRIEDSGGIIPLIFGTALMFLSFLLGSWWQDTPELRVSEFAVFRHAFEAIALGLIWWSGLAVMRKLRANGWVDAGKIGKKGLILTLTTGLAAAVPAWLSQTHSAFPATDHALNSLSHGLVAALFVALVFVSGSFRAGEKRRGRYLAFGGVAIIVLSGFARASIAAFHGTPEAVVLVPGLAALVAAIFVFTGLKPAYMSLIDKIRRTGAEDPFQRRKVETQKRLTTAFAVMVLFFGILLIAMLESVNSDQRVIEDAHVEQQKAVANSLTRNVDGSLVQLAGILRRLARDPEVLDANPVGMRKAFQSLPRSWDEAIKAITRIDSNGIIEYTYPEFPEMRGKSIADRPHVRYFLRNRRFTVSAPFESFRGFKAVSALYPVYSGRRGGRKVFVGGIGLIVPDKVLSGRMFTNVSILNPSPVAAINMDGKVISESIGGHAGDSADRYLESIFRGDTSSKKVDRVVGEILHVSKLSVLPIVSKTVQGEDCVVAAPIVVAGNRLGAMIVPVRSYEFARIYREAASGQVRLWTYLLVVFVGLAGGVMYIYHRWSSFLEREAKRESGLARENEGRYTKLFDNALMGIFTANADGEITSGNLALARMLGYNGPERLYGRKIFRADSMLEALSGPQGGSREIEPVMLYTAYGVPVYVRMSCRELKDSSGTTVGYEGFVEDVTASFLARKAIRETEKRYSELFKLSPAGVYVTSLDGRILEANESFARIFGYESAAEMLDMHASALYADSTQREEFVSELRKSGSVQHRVLMARKEDGTSAYIYENAELGFDSSHDVEVIHGALMDVTELVHLQQQVDLHRRVAESASEILTAAFQGGDIANIISRSLDSMGRSLDLAGAFILQRYGKEMHRTHEWWSDVSLKDRDAAIDGEAFENAFRDGAAVRAFDGTETGFDENPVSRTYGRRSFTVTRISSKGSTWGYLLLLARIPGRKWKLPEMDFLESANRLLAAVVERDYDAELRDHLESQRDELLFAVEQLTEAVVVSDTDGIIRYVNNTFTRLTGFSSEDVIGKGTDMLRSEEHEPAFFKKLWDTITAGNIFKARFKSRRKDGAIVYLDKTIAPVIDSNGKVVSFVEVSNDVTGQISLEEQLTQSQKMESIGLLAGGIAHDFNNILGAILGYASLMKSKIPQEHEFYKYTDTIERSATRAAELTSQLLAFARGGKYNVVHVNVNEVIEDTLRIIRSTFDRSIIVETDLAEGISAIEGDPGQVQQVIMNLCVNARDAMPAGGVLRVGTAELELAEKDCASNVEAKPGRYVLVSVHDTGIGMDGPTMKRIFEPFFTTKEKGKGTGLGLSMVYGIVHNHGGFVNVESEPGKGTTFRVYCPSAGEIRETWKEEGVTSRMEGGSETILVAEDDPGMRELVNEVLESGGYRVVTVSDGESAIKTFAEKKGEIDLVILDMIMPKLNGSETFRRLKAIDKDVRVLLSSGYSQDGQAQGLLAEGVAGFLGKPYQVSELLAKVRHVLAGRGDV